MVNYVLWIMGEEIVEHIVFVTASFSVVAAICVNIVPAAISLRDAG